jgi:uncharacterized protein (TIGR01777 family)
MRVFVAGGTGLIGSRLIRRLYQRQDKIILLTRRSETAREALGSMCSIVDGEPTRPGPWMEALEACDAVVNLTGENLFRQRWNAAFKQAVHDSRVKTTEHLVRALGRRPFNAAGSPRVLVNASAVGYYGAGGDEVLTEESPPGKDFLARLCVAWEQAARGAEAQGIRVALVRIGVVLAREGGALGQLLPTFQIGMGGPTGSGRQWISWIHHADLVSILLLALDQEAVKGPINAMAPNPVMNRDFAERLGRALHRPALITTPAFALRLLLGEAADMVLTGQRVLPKKALSLGYTFQFPTLDEALADVLK